tara:strand:+ start:834 stop:1667 length:834 start_codon:yes stop_codon:yes gene_type:complete
MTDTVVDTKIDDVPQDLSPLEEKALDKGWRPEDEWSGEADQWRPAKEFLDRGELMDRISDQTRQLRGQKDELATIKTALKEMGTHNSKIAEKEYDKAMLDLKSLKVQAMEVDDYERIVDVDEQILELKEAKKEVVETPVARETHPEIESWMAANQWYGRDVIMRGAADSISQEYMNMNPEARDNPKDVLEYVEKVMREEFPHKFGEKPAQRRRPTVTSEVGEPVARSTGRVKYTSRDMNGMQKKICKTFIEAGAFKTEQEYVDQLVELGEIDKQKGL